MKGEFFLKNILKWGIRLLPFLYMVVIWILSSLPSNAVVELPDSSLDRMIKESLHLVEFAILYVLFVAALLTTGKFSKRLSILCAVAASLYGLLDEFHQSFVPYRSATVIDLVKDVTGVLVAFYFVQRGYRKHGFNRVMEYFK
jgi:VanZ family protein